MQFSNAVFCVSRKAIRCAKKSALPLLLSKKAEGWRRWPPTCPAIYGTLIYMAIKYLFTDVLVRQNAPTIPRLSGRFALCSVCYFRWIWDYYALHVCKCGQSFRRFRAAQEVSPWLRIPGLFEELRQSSADSCALLSCTSGGHNLVYQSLLTEVLPICGLFQSLLSQCIPCDTWGTRLDIYSNSARGQKIRRQTSGQNCCRRCQGSACGQSVGQPLVFSSHTILKKNVIQEA